MQGRKLIQGEVIRSSSIWAFSHVVFAHVENGPFPATYTRVTFGAASHSLSQSSAWLQDFYVEMNDFPFGAIANFVVVIIARDPEPNPR